jgi:hypothetical protein
MAAKKRRQYKYLREKSGHDGESRQERGYGRCRSGMVEQSIDEEEPDCQIGGGQAAERGVGWQR